MGAAASNGSTTSNGGAPREGATASSGSESRRGEGGERRGREPRALRSEPRPRQRNPRCRSGSYSGYDRRDRLRGRSRERACSRIPRNLSRSSFHSSGAPAAAAQGTIATTITAMKTMADTPRRTAAESAEIVTIGAIESAIAVPAASGRTTVAATVLFLRILACVRGPIWRYPTSIFDGEFYI